MSFLLVVLALFVAMVVFIAVVARVEKRMVWPYGPLQAQPAFGSVAGYGASWVAEASRLRFDFLGWAPDEKGPKYRVNYGFLVSPEGDCLAIVGVGTVFGLPLQGTWIYTRLAGNDVLYTTDNQSCVEIDVTRRWLGQLAPVRTFTELLGRHRQLQLQRGTVARPFSAGREAEEWKHFRLERYQALAHQGAIEFTNAAGTHWRYTVSGALRWTALNYAIGLLRGFTGGRVPKVA